MAGVKGRSGTNKGKDKPWQDALRLAVHRVGEDNRPRLLLIAEKCVEAALEGKMDAIKEIGDRLDGKPAQESNVTMTRLVAQQLGDDELAHIAAGGGEGTDTQEISPPVTH
jgi:hypothetical protein